MTPRRRLLLVFGAAGSVSIASNVLAADASLVGRAVAAWFPISLMLVVDVLARVTIPDGVLRWVAMAGTAAVASVAAVASFNHMFEVASTAGEPTLVAYLFPLSVDGLMIVTSVALAGIARTETVDQVDELPAPADGLPLELAAVRPEPATGPTPRFVPLPAPVGTRSLVLNGARPINQETNLENQDNA